MPYHPVVNEAGLIETRPIDPAEKFVNAEGSNVSESKVLDYWAWAFSDIVGNTERGHLAEYLVSMAVGAESPVRNGWAASDIDSPDGTKIEVKSSAYVQTWYQEKITTIKFGISKSLEWFPETNLYCECKRRHSDVYVFCVVTPKEKHLVNTLDLDQWEFYVIPTPVLDREFGDRKSIALNRVRKYSDKYHFRQLREEVSKASGKHIASGKQWNEQSFFEKLAQRPEGEVGVARRIIAWASDTDLRLRWGKGEKKASFYPMLDHAERVQYTVGVFASYKSAYVILNLPDMINPFDEEQMREKLLTRLRDASGWEITHDQKYPSLYFSELLETSKLEGLLGVLDWVIVETRACS